MNCEERNLQFFNEYFSIITSGKSIKSIYNKIYNDEFLLYLRKGYQPRIEELNVVLRFLSTKDDSKQYYIWRTESDACSICKERNGRVYKEKPEPAHPNCQCEIEEIDEKEGDERIKKNKNNLENKTDLINKLNKKENISQPTNDSLRFF
jgi:hypothetical protein